MAKELYMLVLVLFSLEGLVQCHESRINLGSKVETFVSWSLDSNKGGNIYVHAIQEDKFIPGNMLAAIGNALYTITSDGYAELLVGSLQDSGFRNGVGTDTSFNKTSGILQVDDGRTVIISDFWNYCLRKLDRTTKSVTTFAGSCNTHYRIGTRGRVCLTRGDGSLDTATFCNVIQMRHVKSTNKIYLLDGALHDTVIRSIDLTTSLVSTVSTNLAFDTRDFLMDEENDDTYIFSASPGILKLDTSTGKGTWLAGCGNANYHGKCPTNEGIRRISTRISHGILSQDGVFVVTDVLGNQVYIVDPENNAFTTLCPSGSQSYCSVRGPASLALIGDYLYIGEAMHPNYYYHTINIKRIKISISPQSAYSQSAEEWLHRDKAPTSFIPNYPRQYDITTRESYNKFDDTSTESPAHHSEPSIHHGLPALIGGLVGGLIGLVFCCICMAKMVSNKGALPIRTNADGPVYRLGAHNETAGYRRGYRRRWWLLLFTFRKRESDTETPPPYERLDERGDNVSPVQPPPYEGATTKHSISGSLSPSP